MTVEDWANKKPTGEAGVELGGEWVAEAEG
jgi:hypothetical protein